MERWEQGTRNRSGARVRSFSGSERLHARLSCQKNMMQCVGNVSSALYPIDFDEDVEVECRHKIVVQNGRKAYQDARAFGIQSTVFAPAQTVCNHDIRKTAAMILSGELCQDALRRGFNGTLYNGSRRSAKALNALSEAVEEMRDRFTKSAWKKYQTGKINEMELLCGAGIVRRK